MKHRLVAVDLVTGTIRKSSNNQTIDVTVNAAAFGNGYSQVNGRIALDNSNHLNRAGLLLVNNMIYVAFASHGDIDFHGWVLAYEIRRTTAGALDAIILDDVFLTTRNTARGAVWQAGNGLVADENGDVYFMIGDGPYVNPSAGAKPIELGDSLLKLHLDSVSKRLSLTDWFTPYNQICLAKCDLDLGSSGPVILPGVHRIIGAGKEGKMYVLDTANLGRFNANCSAPNQNICTATPNPSLGFCTDRVVQTFQVGQGPVAPVACRGDLPYPIAPEKGSPLPFVAGWNGEGGVVDTHSHVHGSPVILPLSSPGTFRMFVWPEAMGVPYR